MELQIILAIEYERGLSARLVFILLVGIDLKAHHRSDSNRYLKLQHPGYHRISHAYNRTMDSALGYLPYTLIMSGIIEELIVHVMGRPAIPQIYDLPIS